MIKRPLVSIVIPFYNEEGAVFGFHEAITRALANLTEFDFEFICINDGSSDNTAEVLDRLAAVHLRLRVVHLAQNQIAVTAQEF